MLIKIRDYDLVKTLEVKLLVHTVIKRHLSCGFSVFVVIALLLLSMMIKQRAIFNFRDVLRLDKTEILNRHPVQT